MSQWIVRNVVLSFVSWTVFAYVTIACLEMLVFGRFGWTEYVPGAIGAGIGLTVAIPVAPLRSRET
ncbi:hypothetical protein [Natronorubrum halophilum]|uniref:hypothetical protein n=1 Tax=Natronorubrum halophilum TaxID=1702106 RepID=UPI000EF6C4A9|nr:hypothetical protein [Natronorubrum halophilum]